MQEEAPFEKLLPIGRFSEMTRLSIKALRLYDEIDLLRPALVDQSSGYRYYSPGQAAKAEAIRALRRAEMPLEEIRQLLSAAPDVAGSLMKNHRDRIAERLAENERTLDFLSELIEGRKQLMPYEVNVKELEDASVASLKVETTLETIAGQIGEGFGKLHHAVLGQGQQISGAPFIVYHDIIDEETPGTIEICAPVSEPIADSGEVKAATIKGGPMATTMHKGRYSEVGPAYHALSTWMSDHGHVPAGPPRETYLNDPTQVPESDLLTEVSWPIDPAE